MAVTKVTKDELEFGGPWTAWTPTITGFSVNPSGIYRYIRTGNKVTVAITQWTNGTSNSTAFTITLPFTAATISNMYWLTMVQTVDNGTSGVGQAQVASGSNILTLYRDAGGNAWTASGNKRTIGCVFTYECA
jgi:hypothetical protein